MLLVVLVALAAGAGGAVPARAQAVPETARGGPAALQETGAAVDEQPIVAGGAPVTAVVRVPRQDVVLTFQGRAGRQVSAVISRDTIAAGELRLEAPGGAALDSTFLARDPSSGFLDTVALPVDGTYRLVVDPSLGHLGRVTVQLFDVPVDIGPITVGAPAQTVRLATPGADAVRTFRGRAGQRVAVTVTANTVPNATVYLTDPEGRAYSSVHVSTARASTRLVTLPRAGTYVVVVDPLYTATGRMAVRVHG